MSLKYYRNLNYQPYKIKLYKGTQTDKQYILSYGYVITYESNTGKMLISIRSKKQPIQFEAETMAKVTKKAEAAGSCFYEFVYKTTQYGMGIQLSGVNYFEKFLKVAEQRKAKPKVFDQLVTTLRRQVANRIVKPIENIFKKKNVQNQTINFIQTMCNLISGELILKDNNISFEALICYMNHAQILVVCDKNTVSLYGVYKGDKLKKVHSFMIPQQMANIRKVQSIENSQFLIMLTYGKPNSLLLFDVEMSQFAEINMKSLYGFNEPILDFIISRQIYKQQLFFLTENRLFRFSLSQYFLKSSKRQVEVLQNSNYKYSALKNHSLSGFAIKFQNNDIILYKSFTLKSFLLRLNIKQLKGFQFSSKFILHWSENTLNLIVLSSLDKNIRSLNDIALNLTPQHITKFGLSDKSILKADFTSNRKYILAVVHNILVVWKLDAVLGMDFQYQIKTYQDVIVQTCNIGGSKEQLWVLLRNGHSLCTFVQ